MAKKESTKGAREGCNLANRLECLVIHIGAALEAEASQVLQACELTQPFARHLHTGLTWFSSVHSTLKAVEVDEHQKEM